MPPFEVVVADEGVFYRRASLAEPLQVQSRGRVIAGLEPNRPARPVPPPPPIPSREAVLDEARQDLAAGRYARAAEKTRALEEDVEATALYVRALANLDAAEAEAPAPRRSVGTRSPVNCTTCGPCCWSGSVGTRRRPPRRVGSSISTDRWPSPTVCSALQRRRGDHQGAWPPSGTPEISARPGQSTRLCRSPTASRTVAWPTTLGSRWPRSNCPGRITDECSTRSHRLARGPRAAATLRASGAESLLPTPERTKLVLEERAGAFPGSRRGRPATSEVLEVVTFDLGGESYAIATRHVRRVVKLERLTSIPGTPEPLVGVINLQGEILPVFDLRVLFGIVRQGPTEWSRVVVLGEDRDEFGVLADSTQEVRTVRLDELFLAPGPGRGGSPVRPGRHRRRADRARRTRLAPRRPACDRSGRGAWGLLMTIEPPECRPHVREARS